MDIPRSSSIMFCMLWTISWLWPSLQHDFFPISNRDFLVGLSYRINAGILIEFSKACLNLPASLPGVQQDNDDPAVGHCSNPPNQDIQLNLDQLIILRLYNGKTHFKNSFLSWLEIYFNLVYEYRSHPVKHTNLRSKSSLKCDILAWFNFIALWNFI